MTEEQDTPAQPRESPVHDFTDIGPECFAGKEDTVISWRGENFYKACGFIVTEAEDGSSSTCVKRVDHPGYIHEDFDGRVKHEIYGAEMKMLEVSRPIVFTSNKVVTKADIRKAWEFFAKPNQIAGEEQGAELLTVMAVLRAINEALPEDEETSDEV